MTDREENKLSMYEAVIKFLDKNEAKLSVIPAFAPLTEALKQAVGQIYERNAEFTAATDGTTNEKKVAENVLINEAVSLAGMCRSYASANGNERLKARTKVTASDLTHMRDTELDSQVQVLRDTITEYLPELGDYGVTEELVTDFMSLADAYHSAMQSREAASAEQSAARQNLTEAFREVDRILYDQIDPLMEAFRTRDPKLYNGYQAVRVIKDIR